ncbi:hypothetical protein MMC30_008887, partial [Trapelia coarctata]|nr:hypothetical protein [Trapelia coarctata]
LTGPQPKRSLPRTLALTALLLLASAVFTMAASPVLPFLSPAPSNPESLTLYTPPSDFEATINDQLLTHPLALSLRQNPSFIESRPHMKILPAARANNLTAGLLTRPDGIPVPPLFFSEVGGKNAVILYYLGKNVCGHPGIVHGGLLATILDEGLARCCFPALPNKVGMTASLKVEYKAPVPAESFVVLRAETRKVEGRKAWVVGRVESLPAEGTEGGKVFVEAEALFIEPRQAATMSKLYPASAG